MGVVVEEKERRWSKEEFTEQQFLVPGIGLSVNGSWVGTSTSALQSNSSRRNLIYYSINDSLSLHFQLFAC